MTRQITRLLIACGVLTCAGAYFGSTYVMTPPDEAPRKAASPKSTPSTKPAGGHDQDAADEKPAPDPAARNVRPKSKEGAATDQPAAEPAHDAANAPVGAADALRQLREGNERWVKDKDTNPNTETSRRSSTAENGQKPFATVLTCADSRIPVERVFDCGVGDVFVIRVAGNVMGPDASGTIEYGAEHLHVPVLIVMGHTRCGAVAAAVAGGDPGGNVSQLVGKIAPAVDRAKQQQPELKDKELTAAAVKENVWQSIFDLVRTSATVRELLHEHKVQIVGAVYDVSSGKVEWIGEHPWQDALVQAFNAKHEKASQTAGATEQEH